LQGAQDFKFRSLCRAEDPTSVKFCFGPTSCIKHDGTVDKSPTYSFFPYLGSDSSVGYNYTKPSLKPLEMQLGGKEAFCCLFSIMTPNNINNCFLAWGAAFSAYYLKLNRLKSTN
jgi:hypothetical protein